MAESRRLSFSMLELKALWLLATNGTRRQPLEITMNPQLAAAGETAIDKIWRAEKGMPPP